MVAREATDEELERLGLRLVELHPDYDVYPRRTSQKIPVVILSPAG